MCLRKCTNGYHVVIVQITNFEVLLSVKEEIQWGVIGPKIEEKVHGFYEKPLKNNHTSIS